MSELRQEKNTADKIEDISDYYGCSSRRLRDHIRAGEVLGVTLVSDNTVFINEPGALYTPQGPVADVPSTFILPKAIKGVIVEPVSGLVTGNVYTQQFTKRLAHLSEIVLSAEQGRSGVMVQISSIV